MVEDALAILSQSIDIFEEVGDYGYVPTVGFPTRRWRTGMSNVHYCGLLTIMFKCVNQKREPLALANVHQPTWHPLSLTVVVGADDCN